MSFIAGRMANLHSPALTPPPKQSWSDPESSPAYEAGPTEGGPRPVVPDPPMVSLHVLIVVGSEIPSNSCPKTSYAKCNGVVVINPLLYVYA